MTRKHMESHQVGEIGESPVTRSSAIPFVKNSSRRGGIWQRWGGKQNARLDQMPYSNTTVDLQESQVPPCHSMNVSGGCDY